MAQKSKAEIKDEELNLVPIMNLVLILIPLLLLSVVFLEITVVNVTMPQKSLGPATSEGEPPQRLQVMVSKEGFWIVKDPSGKPEPPIGACAARGPNSVTICLKDNSNVETPTVEAYNWLELYNYLQRLKRDPKWAAHETVEIVAGPAIPFGILVKTMDVTRYQRASTPDATSGMEFSSEDELNASQLVTIEAKDNESNLVRKGLGLFELVVLGVPTPQ